MKWFLIIITIVGGGLFGSNKASQQKLGPYSTKESCRDALYSVPEKTMWDDGYIINAFCIQVEE